MKPNDEGVCVLSGIWFNSTEFQNAIDDNAVSKVSVFIDPENLTEATAIIPGVVGEFRLQLQVSAFADLTVPEVLKVTEAYRMEDPTVTEIYEDRIASTRRALSDQLGIIRVENKLTRSYSTFDECKAKARHVYHGTRTIPSPENLQTVRPGEINSPLQGPGVLPIGASSRVTSHGDVDPANAANEGTSVTSEEPASIEETGGRKGAVEPKTKQLEIQHQPIGRPKTKGTFK